ncbi:MAG: AraC family transcriptional regulator [Kofleriaceae bacterium]|nr:AraC family transcriptional regulator [Kofleriaceae bacterium]MCB9573904.1 AraC family transcriptional regulator [Kofleriaceae bacterium]
MAFQVSARIGAMIVQAAVRHGVDPAEITRETGFDPTLAGDPDARIDFAVEEALWATAARLTGDDAFGLHAAEALRPGAFDVLDYAVRTAPTVRAALDRVARYNRLEHDVATFTIGDAGDPEVVRIEHRLAGVGVVQHRHSAEMTMASLVVVAAQISGAPVVARAVELRHAAPASTAEHVRVLGVEPRFDAATNAVELAREVLDRPCPAADPVLARVIERHAEALLAARPDPAARTSQRVRALLAQLLGEQDASLGAVAARLRLSERSLQRRLADEGLTFDAVLDDLRRELALRYLADPRIAIAEVAYLLAYSETSAFHRAFKRWTGATPAEARRRAA